MKRVEREAYLILTRIHLPEPFDGHMGLCNLCRYASFSGDPCCGDSELACEHPIEKIEENSWDAWGGGDCWAFRPQWSREDCVDLVGIHLQGLWPDYKALEETGARRVVRIPPGLKGGTGEG